MQLGKPKINTCKKKYKFVSFSVYIYKRNISIGQFLFRRQRNFVIEIPFIVNKLSY